MSDPRSDVYLIVALLDELDRVLNPFAGEERGDIVATPTLPPALPPVTPRGAPPRSAGSSTPPRGAVGRTGRAAEVAKPIRAAIDPAPERPSRTPVARPIAPEIRAAIAESRPAEAASTPQRAVARVAPEVAEAERRAPSPPAPAPRAEREIAARIAPPALPPTAARPVRRGPPPPRADRATRSADVTKDRAATARPAPRAHEVPADRPASRRLPRSATRSRAASVRDTAEPRAARAPDPTREGGRDERAGLRPAVRRAPRRSPDARRGGTGEARARDRELPARTLAWIAPPAITQAPAAAPPLPRRPPPAAPALSRPGATMLADPRRMQAGGSPVDAPIEPATPEDPFDLDPVELGDDDSGGGAIASHERIWIRGGRLRITADPRTLGRAPALFARKRGRRL